MVVAYNASSTITRTLDRIPSDMEGLAAILVSDDYSADDTTEVASSYASRRTDLPITVIRQPRNLGYGGNQKFCYRWAMRHDLDTVVLLHGDGQYAPELLPEMAAPIISGEADMVSGSRMMNAGAARAGGMPLYKYVGNRILTTYQNMMSGLRLSEWHSGYRAFSIPALTRVPFEDNSDDFDFDTEVLLQMAAAGNRITEIAIPTHYGDEICYVNGMAYARDVVIDVTRMRLARMGFGTAAPGTIPEDYMWQDAHGSDRPELTDLLAARSPGNVLDLRCGGGPLTGEAKALGNSVTAIDREASTTVEESVDLLVIADLDDGLPDEILKSGQKFDTVVVADVFEHIRHPDQLLQQLHKVTSPHSTLLTSFPNFAHWYPRIRVSLGRFDYDRRGILDNDHVRFFTSRSFNRMVRSTGWETTQLTPVGFPFDVIDRGGHPGVADRVRTVLGRLDRALSRRWPNLFAYQYVAELRSTPEPLE